MDELSKFQAGWFSIIGGFVGGILLIALYTVIGKNASEYSKLAGSLGSTANTLLGTAMGSNQSNNSFGK